MGWSWDLAWQGEKSTEFWMVAACEKNEEAEKLN
jgi:hypothetical protein